MRIKFKKNIDKDTNQIDGFDIVAEGFVPTWAYRTGDQSQSFWEFDVVHMATGLENHIVIPYTASVDLFETFLVREFMSIMSHVEAWVHGVDLRQSALK